MAANVSLQRVEEHGWRRGFANLLRKENRDWWGTRRWWINLLIWTLMLNATLAIPLWLQSGDSPPDSELTPEEQAAWIEGHTPESRAASGIGTFVDFSGAAAMFGVIIIMQNVLIDEKRSGTAAWLLSKPVSRTGIIVAKLVANALAAFAIIVLAQWALAYAQILLATGAPPPAEGFLLGAMIAGLNMLFYLTLMLMLGTLFNNRGAVVAIPFVGLFLVMYFASNMPALVPYTPLPLIFGTLSNAQDGFVHSMAMDAASGAPLRSITPIIVTCAWCVVFVGVAVWRFHREEF